MVLPAGRSNLRVMDTTNMRAPWVGVGAAETPPPPAWPASPPIPPAPPSPPAPPAGAPVGPPAGPPPGPPPSSQLPPKTARRRIAAGAGLVVLSLAAGLTGGWITGLDDGVGRRPDAWPWIGPASTSPATPSTWPACSASVQSSVVSIETTVQVRQGPFVNEGEGAGTGIVLDDDGYILTNAHVVSGADQHRGDRSRRRHAPVGRGGGGRTSRPTSPSSAWTTPTDWSPPISATAADLQVGDERGRHRQRPRPRGRHDRDPGHRVRARPLDRHRERHA